MKTLALALCTIFQATSAQDAAARSYSDEDFICLGGRRIEFDINKVTGKFHADIVPPGFFGESRFAAGSVSGGDGTGGGAGGRNRSSCK